MAMLVFKTVVMRSCVFRKWVGKGDFFLIYQKYVGIVPDPAHDTQATHARLSIAMISYKGGFFCRQ